MTIIGYARVSTDGQSVEAQQAQLKAAGAERIYAEKVSGIVTDRKALAKAIASLAANGEPLVDIGRSYGVSHSTKSRL